MECDLKEHGLSTVIMQRVASERTPPLYGSDWEVANSSESATNRACNRVEVPTSIVARRLSALTGTPDMLPRAKNVSSAARVSDGMLQLNSEGSLHYCLLLGGGDTNNRGEDDEGFNTPVCSLCICWQRSIISQYRTCAKTDFLIQ